MRTDRLPLAVLLAALVTGAAACGASGGPEAITDPRPTTTSTPQPASDPPGDDEIVWQEFTGGGFVPREYALRLVPAVTIYGDGRIFRVADSNDSTLRPLALEEAKVPAEDLTDFLQDAIGSGLFEPGVDFGDPMITDMSSTSVALRTGEAAQTVDVYALTFDLDDSIGGVTEAQRERREKLQGLMKDARALAKDPQPYVPDQVRANLVTAGSQPDDGDAVAWPGPALSAFPEPEPEGPDTSCLVIEGSAAAAVTEAAATNNDAAWMIDGEVRQIITAPMLPGEEGCPPR
jgi:hypothetical protein